MDKVIEFKEKNKLMFIYACGVGGVAIHSKVRL